MTDTGIVDRETLEMLLSEYADSSDSILALMSKFGLLVHLHNITTQDKDKLYLVPALLPNSSVSEQWSDQVFIICFCKFICNNCVCHFVRNAILVI